MDLEEDHRAFYSAHLEKFMLEVESDRQQIRNTMSNQMGVSARKLRRIDDIGDSFSYHCASGLH